MPYNYEEFHRLVQSSGSVKQFADMTGMHRSAIWRLCTNRRQPDFYTLNAIKQTFPAYDLNRLFTADEC